MFDILLRGGLLVDPSQGLHRPGTVAIKDGKIASVGGNEAGVEARKVIPMEGKIIAAGLIDIHCHPVAGFAELGVPADEIGLNSGVTLLCDGGSSGWANFEALQKFIVNPAKTDMFCFLNMASTGLIAMPEIWSERNMGPEHARQTIESHGEVIKGVKIRAVQALAEGVGLRAIEIAKKLANDVNLPLMLHIGETRARMPRDKMDDFSRAAVSLLEGGDILSHYLTWEPGGLILRDGTVYPELEAAKKRGVILDSSHGLNHFSFIIARHAIRMGLLPTVISTDMASINLSVVQSLPMLMSKFINMGLSLDQVIEMTTINPARALGEEERRGSLKTGRPADMVVLEMTKGAYVFGDGKGGGTLDGDVILEPRMVFKGGELMPAYNRYQMPPIFAEG
jgi:dihydroorotase